MDSRTFDDLARRFGRKQSRRRAFRILAVAVTEVMALPRLRPHPVAAQFGCSFGQTECDTGFSAQCVDLDTDPDNCGACGNTCSFAQRCNNGRCGSGVSGQALCSLGQTRCQFSCVDLDTDDANCGACGYSCGFGLTCSRGQCGTTCDDSGFGPPKTPCQTGLGVMARTTCVDLKSDADHCGACGNDCDSGLICRDGECGCEPELAFGAPRIACPTGIGALRRMICVDLQRDPDHCGACGSECDSGLICRSGRCDCEPQFAFSPERTPCPVGIGTMTRMTCVDLESDPEHCGACDVECDSGLICRNGECACEPEFAFSAERTACPTGIGVMRRLTCVDLQSDPDHCGDCEVQCDVGCACEDATCICDGAILAGTDAQAASRSFASIARM
jgi:hypothetical protein